MWTLSATARTTATPEQVWTIYRDVANWPEWDKGLARYQPNGAFATGTEGVLQPVGGPELPFTLIQVEAERTFVDSTPISEGVALIGRHELIAVAGRTHITHTVEIDAPNAAEIAQAMGFEQAELQATVDALARYAEAQARKG